MLPPLIPQQRTESIPVSIAQRRFWLVKRLRLARRATYEEPIEIRFRGRLDHDSLRSALDDLVARHEILRTRFPLRLGLPVQAIDLPREVDWTFVDLSRLLGVDRGVAIQRLREREATGHFEVDRGPLLRVTLVKLCDEQSVLLLKIHHLIFDGWSLQILLAELGKLYSARCTGGEFPLVDLPVQYADFALWQRQWLHEDLLNRQLSYWQRRLAGVSPLRLPTDFSRPSTVTSIGACLPIEVGAEMTLGLRKVARSEEATLPMVILTVLQVLLWGWSAQTDIAVATPVCGRVHRLTEGLIGCFVNALVIRSDLAGDPSFRALLAQTRRASLEAYAHQCVTLEKLVTAVECEIDPRFHPICQVQYVHQNVPRSKPEFIGLSIDARRGERRSARYDLTLDLEEDEDELSGKFIYAADLFSSQTIETGLDTFKRIAARVIANPMGRISSLIA